ncbi:MAG: hypothetical protein OEM50_05440 [Gammaproteobacteria bacterium]|nr:hypothetical protein [Gammaproteobacteria bacterium]MDH3481140.1 hypothetical protein [Gammaproteobacteria bacterium]
MISDLMTILRQVGSTIYSVFVLPGEVLLSWISELAPAAAAQLNIIGDAQPALPIIVLSLLFWLLLAFAVAKIWRLLQSLFRTISAAGKALSFRFSLAYGIIRKKLLHGLQRLFPRRTTRGIASSRVEFDDLDLAVLRSAAACGPGFTTSAPELAEQLKYRPAQIQRSLSKLSRNKLLDGVIGSTDGFENYRLSQSGSHYVAMLHHERSNSKTTAPRS